jgi:hypothetical protein
MEINYSMSPDDFIEAQTLHVWGTSRKRIRIAIVVISLLILLGAGFLYHFERGAGLGLVTLCLILLFAFLVWVPAEWKKYYRRSPALGTPTFMNFTETGLEMRGEDGASRSDWSRFVKWKQSQEMFLLYMQPALFLCIPLRVLSPEQQSELASLFEKQVGRRSKFRKGV